MRNVQYSVCLFDFLKAYVSNFDADLRDILVYDTNLIGYFILLFIILEVSSLRNKSRGYLKSLITEFGCLDMVYRAIYVL